MKFHRFFYLFIFVFTLQTNAQNVLPNWNVYSSVNGEISFELPSKPVYFFDNDGFSYLNVYGNLFHFAEMQMIQSASDETYFSVEIYKVKTPKNHLDEYAEKSGLTVTKIDSDSKDFTLKIGVLNERFPRVKKIIDRISYETRFISSKTHLYVFTVWKRGKVNLNFEHFLSSIKFSQTKNNSGKTISIDTLNPLTINDIGEQMPKENAKLLLDKPDYEANNPNDLTLLLIPFPGITGEVRRNRVNGSVKFLVKFSKDGRIEKISLISGSQAGLVRNSFFSALRFKFLPKISDGKAVTTEHVYSYKFTR